MSRTKIFISAGEESGDVHGSRLVEHLIREIPGAEIYGIGGDRMKAAGCRIVRHIRDLSCAGLTEVVANIPRVMGILGETSRFIAENKVDILVTIDFSGFNLRLAEKAREAGAKNVYYISPQVWAWRRRRVRKIARLYELVLVIFPFEVDFYSKYGVKTEFVGHPLLDDISPGQFDVGALRSEFGCNDARAVGLFPGSREKEVSRLLPQLIGAARILAKGGEKFKFLVSIADGIDEKFVRSVSDKFRGSADIEFVRGRSVDVMAAADLCIVKSGTSTVECALVGTPFIVVYKVSALTYRLLKLMVNVEHVAMPNIIAGKRIVPELMQSAASADGIAAEALAALKTEKLAEIRSSLVGVGKKLGVPGAAARAARRIAEIAGA